MNKNQKGLAPIAIILIMIVILVGGVFAWQYFEERGEKAEVTEVEQGVRGVIRGTPYRGMPGPDMPLQPIEQMGPLLFNITIQIREYLGKDQRAGKIITSATTDKNGFYKITLPEGTYFLTVVDADVRYALITTGYQGKNFSKEEKINTYVIIDITSNEIIEQNLGVPQGWPE